MIPLLAITTLNQADSFRRLIESIDYPVRTVSVLCNSYSFDYLLKIHASCKSEFVDDFMISHCPYNMGCSTSWNYHMKMNPECDYWIFAGDDLLFSSGDLARAHDAARSYDAAFCNLGPKYSLFSLSKKCVNVVGFFDENIHPAYFEDNNYDDRLRNTTMSIGFFEYRGHHFGSGTSHHLSEENKNKLKHCYKLNEHYYKTKVTDKFDFEERSKKLLIVK
jgi:hypothetical protein